MFFGLGGGGLGFAGFQGIRVYGFSLCGILLGLAIFADMARGSQGLGPRAEGSGLSVLGLGFRVRV